MKCIRCKKETPDTEIYCRHCGMKLNISYEEITEKLGKDIETEKKEEIENFIRWIILLLFFIFFIGWIFGKLWEKPYKYEYAPVYIPKNIKIPQKWDDIYRTLIIIPPEELNKYKKNK